MEKREQQKRQQSEYEQGIMEVNQQIMDSYNSGMIGQEQMNSVLETEEDLK